MKLAVYDKDLKARIYKKFPVSDDGTKILVKSGGKANFNPEFDNDSFIEFPKRSLLKPWVLSWQRVYFVAKMAKKCNNFQTKTVLEPDPSLVLKAAQTTMLNNLGREKAETSILTWIQIGLLVFIALKVLGVIA